jgi:hypothetical protein
MSFLTEDELEYYTGYTQPAAQVRFLKKWGINHVVNAAGRPRVTWDQVNGKEESTLATHTHHSNEMTS